MPNEKVNTNNTPLTQKDYATEMGVTFANDTFNELKNPGSELMKQINPSGKKMNDLQILKIVQTLVDRSEISPNQKAIASDTVVNLVGGVASGAFNNELEKINKKYPKSANSNGNIKAAENSVLRAFGINKLGSSITPDSVEASFVSNLSTVANASMKPEPSKRKGLGF
jgi:hypothetical protein